LIKVHTFDEQSIIQDLVKSIVALSTGRVSMYLRIGSYNKMCASALKVTQCVIFYFLCGVFVKQQKVKKGKKKYVAFRFTMASE